MAERLVDSRTRAGADGRWVRCPNCLSDWKVYHFSWTAISCPDCGKPIEKKSLILRD